jgi:hypothetical protein
MKSVHSAVRTGSLNKAVCASYSLPSIVRVVKFEKDEMGRTCGANGGGKRGAQGVGGET